MEDAEVDRHWAYIAPKQVEIPQVDNSDWPRNAIDNFILARLEAEGLETFILERGEFLSPSGRVFPDTPAFLPPMAEDLPRNQLGLARWLTSPENVLRFRLPC